jgi:AraC-like DNA-binding protein
MKGSGDFDVLFVSPDVFLQAAEERGILGQVHFRLSQFEDRRLSYAIQGLVRSIQADESRLEQQTWLALCLQGMQLYTERKPRADSGRTCAAAINLARNYLRDHFREPVGLDELATLTGLNRFSLVHCFSSKLGLPPHAYQIHIQVERARALLGLGVPPATVAADVGFSDQSHLSRQFKKIMQVTPGQYQRCTCRSPIQVCPVMERLPTPVKHESSLVLAR